MIDSIFEWMAANMGATDLQIDWLRTFVAIVDAGSLTAAARQVARSQSAVSMQLKKLEASVGAPLLNRGPRRMSLTPAGYDLLGDARELLDLHARALVKLHGQRVRGRVSLGVPDDYVMAYLAPILRAFPGRFAEVEVTLVCEPSTTLLARLERGEIDLAVATRESPGAGEVLFREALVWAASEQHEVWKRDPLPIAVHGIDSRIRAAVLAAIAASERDYRVAYASPNLAGQLAMAESGLAVAVITQCSLPATLRRLDSRDGLPDLPEIEVVVLRGKHPRRTAAVEVMYEQIVGCLQRPPRGAAGGAAAARP